MKILIAKKGDRHADTSELEKMIDKLVYELHRLTYEEVKIIEPEHVFTSARDTSSARICDEAI